MKKGYKKEGEGEQKRRISLIKTILDEAVSQHFARDLSVCLFITNWVASWFLGILIAINFNTAWRKLII